MDINNLKSSASPKLTKEEIEYFDSQEKVNLFDKVEFGDKFLTRDGRKASFVRADFWEELDSSLYEIIIEDGTHIWVTSDGFVDYEKNIKQSDDIVSRYQESVIKDVYVHKWLKSKTGCGMLDAKIYLKQLIEAILHHTSRRTDCGLKLVYDVKDKQLL